MADQSLKAFDWPLNGRLITKLDGSQLPEGHFQTLQNMRYNDGGIEGIQGMTKINASAFSYTDVKGGFHFKKEIPNTENHILVQTTESTNSRIVKSDNTTSIPAQDTFSTFVTLPTTNLVNFSEAPDESMVFCDGYTNYVYSGSEYRVAKVINFDPAGTYSYDYTTVANNNLTDSNNVFSLKGGLGGGLDTSTMTLLHFDNNVTDSATQGNAPFTYTATDLTYSTTYKVFGTHGAVFNGTSSVITTGDDANFDFSGGKFTIDGWFYVTDLTAASPIFYQQTDANNYIYFYIDTDGSIKLSIYDTGAEVVACAAPAGTITTHPDTGWKHIALVENDNDYYIFVDGVQCGYVSDANRAANYTGNVTIGSNGVAFFYGYMDELRVSSSARWTSDFTPPVAAYSGTSSDYAYLYIGSARPISGVKFYIKTANATASTVSGFYWNGSSWTAVGSLVDGTLDTATSTITLAQTGTMSFTSTVDLCKVKAIKNNVAYYYQFVFSDVDTAAAISQISVVCPVQALVDIWDGQPRQLYSCIKYDGSTYTDYTQNTYALDFLASLATTFVNMGGFTSSQYMYFGFNERMLGVKFYLGETNVNTNAAIMSIDYWNGTTWATVGSIDDGTSVGGKSFNRSGVVTWNPPAVTSEYVNSVGNSAEWYYYRVHFSATLSGTVYLDNVIGIPAQVDIKAHKFAVLWQNRLWLLNDQSRNKNCAIGSSYGTVCVFNGTDSPLLSFGGPNGIECAAPLYTRYGGNVYENLIVCKRNQTYLVDGTSPSNYIVYKIADTTGCIAPQTTKVCDTGYEVAPGLTKHVILWLSASGVVMFDANSLINVSGDIGDRFEEGSTNYINESLADKFTAFYDAARYEYHLLIATGSSTTLNEEWVYDLVHRKWWLANRKTKYITCGINIEDSVGNRYIFGGTDDGYLERLEYGNTFDGVAIEYKFRLADNLLDKSLMYIKEIRGLKLTGIVSTTASTITVNHYLDGSTTASTPAIPVINQNVSGKRIYQVFRSISFKGVFHGFEFIISTSDGGVFRPLYVSGLWRTLREDLEGNG
jgi:hypothetical protein